MKNLDDYVHEEDEFNSKIEHYLKNNMNIGIEIDQYDKRARIYIQLIVNENVIAQDEKIIYF